MLSKTSKAAYTFLKAGPTLPPKIPVSPSSGLKNVLERLPDLKPLPKALNLSRVPSLLNPPFPTTFPPTEPKLPTPLKSLPVPKPDKPPVIAPFKPLPAATLVAAPIAPANTGPTPGIKLANGPAIGIFFCHFLPFLFLKGQIVLDLSSDLLAILCLLSPVLD